MHFRTQDGEELYYEVKGVPGASTTLIFLNGLTQSTASWSLMLPYFETKYRILLVDFVFQGQSSGSGDWRNFDQHAADIAALLAATGAGRTAVIGLSYGSLVAQHLAVNYPYLPSKLVLLSTFAHKTPYYDAIETAWWRALQTGGYDLLLDVMLPTVLSEGYFENPLVPLEKMKEARKTLNRDPARILKLMTATRERADYREKLRSVKCPALVIHGEKDLLIAPHLGEEVSRQIPNAVFHLEKGAGHTLNLEHVSSISRRIAEFMQD